MKKTIVGILFTLLNLKQYAQIEKGTYVPSISFNGTYSSNPQKDTISTAKQYNWSATTSLGFGRFIKNNLLFIGSFSYGHSNSKQDYIDDKYYYRNDGRSSFGNTESIGASLLKYKFITENFAVRYGVSCSISYTEFINRHYFYNVYYANSSNSYQYQNQTSYTNTLSAQLNLLAGIHIL